MKLSELLKEYRKKQGTSQEELAKQIGISRSYIAKIENNKAKSIDITIIKKICNFLNLTFEEEYKLYEEYNYNNVSEIISNIKGIKGSDKINLLKNNNRINIIKILKNYKNNNLKLDETISLLNVVLGIDIRKYMDEEDIKKYNLKDLTIKK